MHRARVLPRLAPLLALLPASLLASPAEAAPPQRGGGFDEGGYIQGSPGVVAVGIGEDDLGGPRNDLELGWPWAFGGGWMFARGRLFKATLGGALEHHILFFDDLDFDDYGFHSLHFLAESRIGAGTNRVWGYGLMGLGPGITVVHVDVGDFEDTDAAPGFNMQFGGGVQGMVYRNFFLGGEFDFDLGFYFDEDYIGDDFQYHTMTIKFLLGWYF